MSKLKSSEAEKSAISHEAKLGVMVITILTFAFGFLVYHKMDLHQRKLTQASIASTAPENAAPQPLDTAAQLAAQGEKSAATDPLMNRSELSDGSPFADTNMLTADDSGPNDSEPSIASAVDFNAIPEATTTSADDVNTPMMTLNEPEDSSPAFSNMQSIESDDIASNSATGSDATEFPTTTDASTAAQFDVTTADVVAASTDITSLATDGFPATDVESDRRGLANNTEDFVNSGLTGTEASEELVPMPVDLLEPSTADAGTSSEVEFEPAPVEDTSRSFSASELSANAASAPAEESEPVLLAMAEPQQENPVFGGFTADDGGVSPGKAPGSELEDSFPAMDATDAKSAARPEAKPEAVIAQQNSPFGSRGFDAVRKPNGRSSKNPIRTAAGSGADGKFSLAAFNYNNNGAQPAPDDGSTFDSVVVQNGDNYTKISKRVYGSIQYFAALAVFNQHRIAEPKNMRPGMVVLTPPKEMLEERYPQLFEDSKPREIEPAGFLLLEDGSPAYRVGQRETLSDVSQRFLGRSSRWTEIYRLNQSNVPDPNKLKAGLILALPADATEVNVTP